MSTTRKSGIYYDETVEYETEENGGKIPVFIGKTGNTATEGYAVDGTQILTFKKFSEVNRSIANGGIGTNKETNPLLSVLEDFFEENEVRSSEDNMGAPYVHVIDVGNGTSKNAWLTALTTAKKERKSIIEFYYGADSITDTGYTLPDFINAAHASIMTETANLNLRTGFATKIGATDAELMALNPATGGILKSRVNIIEPDKFGKIAARICTTPYYIEPGFLPFRSVGKGEFKSRTDAEITALQNAGIIIGIDEGVDDYILTRINLGVSTSYALDPRPADAWLHHRFNADNLLRRVFKAIYSQVKANETVSYIVKAQTQVDAVIDDEVDKERMIKFDSKTGKGTKLTLRESDSNPFDMKLEGPIQGINATHAIYVSVTIKNPATKTVTA